MSLTTTSPGLLTITAQSETLPTPSGSQTNTSAIATVYLGKIIPHQVLIMRGYRVEMDTAAHALTQRVVYVDVPWLGSSNLTDGLSYMNRLPLYLDDAVVTIRTEMTTPLQLNYDIQQQFTMQCYNRDGTLVNTSQVLSVSCQFSYGSNSVSGI